MLISFHSALVFGLRYVASTSVAKLSRNPQSRGARLNLSMQSKQLENEVIYCCVVSRLGSRGGAGTSLTRIHFPSSVILIMPITTIASFELVKKHGSLLAFHGN